MFRFFQTIKVICFWGFVFLLFLMIAFGIQINDLMYEALSGNIHIRIISIFLLTSPLLYIIIAVIQFIRDKKDGQFVFHHIGSSLLPNFWPIYKVFDFRSSVDWGYFAIQAILWWGISIYGIASICAVKDNRIISKIQELNSQQIWSRISLFIGACLALYLLALILLLIVFRLLRKDIKKYGIFNYSED